MPNGKTKQRKMRKQTKPARGNKRAVNRRPRQSNMMAGAPVNTYFTNTGSGKMETVVFSGSETIWNTTAAPGDPLGAELASFALNPAQWEGSKVAARLLTYARYRIRKLKLKIVAQCATSVGGGYAAGLDYDVRPISGSKLLGYVQQLDQMTDTNIWQAILLNADCRRMHQAVPWFFTDKETPPEQQFAAWFYLVLSSTLNNITSGEIGIKVIAEYTIEAAGGKAPDESVASDVIIPPGSEFHINGTSTDKGRVDGLDFATHNGVIGGVYEVPLQFVDPEQIDSGLQCRAFVYSTDGKLYAWQDIGRALDYDTSGLVEGTGTTKLVEDTVTFIYLGKYVTPNSLAAQRRRMFRRTAGGTR